MHAESNPIAINITEVEQSSTPPQQRRTSTVLAGVALLVFGLVALMALFSSGASTSPVGFSTDTQLSVDTKVIDKWVSLFLPFRFLPLKSCVCVAAIRHQHLGQ